MPVERSEIPDNISRVCYVLTVFFNTTLIYLSIWHTKQIVGTYRAMIVTFATLGIAFSTLDILVRPLFHSYNGCFLYFTLGSTFRTSKRAAEIGLLAYSSTYAILLAFLAVQFMYRACVVARPSWMPFFDRRKIVWCGYILVNGLFWVGATLFVYPDDNSYEYVRNEMMSNYGVEIRGVPCFLVLAYNETPEGKWIRWNSVVTIATTGIVLTVQYSIMVVCGVTMYRRTKGRLTTASTCHERLQKQFFIALLCQVTAPSLVFHLPALFVLTAPFFDLKFSFHSRIVIYGFSAYPLVDSLILLRVITEYRNAYRRFLKWLVGKCFECLGGDTPRNTTHSTASMTLAKI